MTRTLRTAALVAAVAFFSMISACKTPQGEVEVGAGPTDQDVPGWTYVVPWERGISLWNSMGVAAGKGRLELRKLPRQLTTPTSEEVIELFRHGLSGDGEVEPSPDILILVPLQVFNGDMVSVSQVLVRDGRLSITLESQLDVAYTGSETIRWLPAGADLLVLVSGQHVQSTYEEVVVTIGKIEFTGG